MCVWDTLMAFPFPMVVMPGAGINMDGFPLYHCWVLSNCKVEFLWLHGAVLWAWGLPAPCTPSHHGHPRGISGNTPFLPSQVQALPLFPLPQAYKERISKLPIFLIVDVLGFVVVVVSFFSCPSKNCFSGKMGLSELCNLLCMESQFCSPPPPLGAWHRLR